MVKHCHFFLASWHFSCGKHAICEQSRALGYLVKIIRSTRARAQRWKILFYVIHSKCQHSRRDLLAASGQRLEWRSYFGFHCTLSVFVFTYSHILGTYTDSDCIPFNCVRPCNCVVSPLIRCAYTALNLLLTVIQYRMIGMHIVSQSLLLFFFARCIYGSAEFNLYAFTKKNTSHSCHHVLAKNFPIFV